MDACSLVGMTQAARKRDARHAPVERFCTSCKVPLRLYDEVEPTPSESAGFIDPDSYACPKCRSETDRLYPDEMRAETRAFYRIGQRLRPCPGCEKCTDSPRLQVMGWVRCIGGRAKLTRIFSRWYQRPEYLLMIYRPGPKWNPAAGGGVTKEDAWANMCNCLREHGELTAICDGSGVLPARAKKVRR